MQTIDPFQIYTNTYESNAKKHLATIIGENQSEDSKNRITLLYSQVSNRPHPVY